MIAAYPEEIKNDVLYANFLGIKIKRKGKYNNKIYIIDENLNKKHVRRIKGIKVVFKGSNSTVAIHKPFAYFVNSSIILKSNCNVEILASRYKINHMEIIASKNNCNINIGKNCSAKNHLEILCNSESNKNVSIGNNCMFGSNVMIRTGDVHTIYNKDNQILNYGGDVTIKDNVWIGYGVTILKGVNIECGCVVGTCSVVTKNCNRSNSIYAGVPAMFKKGDIYWSRLGIEKFKKEADAIKEHKC